MKAMLADLVYYAVNPARNVTLLRDDLINKIVPLFQSQKLGGEVKHVRF